MTTKKVVKWLEGKLEVAEEKNDEAKRMLKTFDFEKFGRSARRWNLWNKKRHESQGQIWVLNDLLEDVEEGHVK